MTYIGLQIAAAAWLVSVAFLSHTKNLKSSIVFNLIPGAVGIGLVFFLLARFMGWPV